MADPGEGADPPALFLAQTKARRAQIFSLRLGPSLFLKVWMTAPTPHI